MASRMKEDERNEKIIRGLLKLPANRRCINCNNLGPQYVCTNFWTFICTNCSGIHREFCHRVKSISMAKFTAQEVNALQEEGNERAKEIYFKEWDPQRHSFPDSSNIDRLRDFIKHVYVDRRFTGERNTDRPPWGKADRDDSNDSRRGDPNLGDSRSPPYDDRYNERLGTGGRNGDRNIRYVYGERSPGYDPGGNKRSPRRFEVVDDRVRDDRYGTGNQIRRFEDRRLPDMASKPERLSPSRPKDLPSPPMVRPVRDILGDDAPQLRVGNAPKSNNVGVPDTSAPVQRTSPSSSMGSNNENSAQSKRVNLGSLIDFTADPEPPVAAAPQPSIPQQTNLPPSNSGDWASFDNAGQQPAPRTTAPQIAPQTAANAGTLESALAQLSTPGLAPMPHMPTLPLSGVDASPKINDGGKWPAAQQHQTSLFSADLSQPANPPFNAPVAGGQPWGLSVVPNIQGPVPNSGGHSAQVASKPPQVASAEVSLQPPSVEAKPTGRKELPADLFAALYPSASVPVPGWQRGPHPGMAYGIQYPMVMPQTMPTYSHQSKSTNPFDVGSEPHLVHAPTFPSVASMQGALPHVPGPSPLARTTSLGNPSPQWGRPQQSFSPAMPHGQYMTQQVPGNMPQMLHNNMVMMGHQGTGDSGSPAALGNLGRDQLPTSRYSLPSTPNSFGSTGGNPFG